MNTATTPVLIVGGGPAGAAIGLGAPPAAPAPAASSGAATGLGAPLAAPPGMAPAPSSGAAPPARGQSRGTPFLLEAPCCS